MERCARRLETTSHRAPWVDAAGRARPLGGPGLDRSCASILAREHRAPRRALARADRERASVAGACRPERERHAIPLPGAGYGARSRRSTRPPRRPGRRLRSGRWAGGPRAPPPRCPMPARRGESRVDRSRGRRSCGGTARRRSRPHDRWSRTSRRCHRRVCGGGTRDHRGAFPDVEHRDLRPSLACSGLSIDAARGAMQISGARRISSGQGNAAMASAATASAYHHHRGARMDRAPQGTSLAAASQRTSRVVQPFR